MVWTVRVCALQSLARPISVGNFISILASAERPFVVSRLSLRLDASCTVGLDGSRLSYCKSAVSNSVEGTIGEVVV